MKKGKKYAEVAKLVNSTNRYSVVEGLELACKTSVAKFDASVDVAFRLNIDPRKAEQNIRGAIVLPNGTGKTRKVLVLCRGAKQQEAQEAGADFVGDSETIQKIAQGWFEFDVIVATPDMMGELGRLGRVLGPKGLMPNPKTGTVTPEIGKAIQEIKAGKIAYRVDKEGNICFSIARVSFDTENVIDNLKVVCETVLKIRPASVKGTYVKNCTLTTVMGPSIRFTFDGR